MKTVNMHEAKTHLSRLVEAASKGEPFVIARAGKPLVKVEAVEQAPVPQLFGFLKDEWAGLEWDEEANRRLDEEIQRMFEASAAEPYDAGCEDEEPGEAADRRHA